jgi:putative Ig domain-containing protein
MINPQAGPSDNGTIASILLQTGPGFVSVDTSTGVVTASPGSGDTGSYPVTVRATDNCGLWSDASFTLTVGQPTSAQLSWFSARYVRRGVELGWRTAHETTVAGFDVFRARAGRLVKVKRRLVAARAAGSPRGATYRLLDRRTRTGAVHTYRLRATTLTGTRVWVDRLRLSPTRCCRGS